MIARVCQFYCLCICAPVYLFMCVRCELCLDVVHGVSVAIKWQISYNLVMFARIEAHQSTRRRALGEGGGRQTTLKQKMQKDVVHSTAIEWLKREHTE